MPRSKPDPRHPEVRPWHPTPYSVEDVHALRKLQSGAANEGQQQRAIKFLIEGLCGTYDMDFIPDSDRETAFAAGKRWVGQQVVKLLNLPPEAVKAMERVEARRDAGASV